MKEGDFVRVLKEEVLKRNLSLYVSELNDHDGAKDNSQLSLIKSHYEGLSDAQKQAFLSSIEIVIRDTISTVLGILDGTTLLDDYREDFELRYGSGERKLNGYLQDVFLALFEDE